MALDLGSQLEWIVFDCMKERIGVLWTEVL